MDRTRSLIAFVGMRDPYPENDEEPGPLLSFLISRPVDEAWLLCTGGTFLERARDVERAAREEGIKTIVHPMDFPLRDVIDYVEIWKLLEQSLVIISEHAGSLPREWMFLLDSGTPQMKTSLFLAARSGLFPARLFQGIPPRFAGGTYKAREISLEGMPLVQLLPSTHSFLHTDSSRRDQNAPQGDDEPLGNAPAFIEALRKAFTAARYDDPVLILGETGTGKTLIARRIHRASARNAAPFVEVNCSAIPESLAESELFGHSRGAFSGAERSRSGKFRAASGGTLFLDEIGDLSLDIQAKILKAIEDREVTPVGSDEPMKADVRLIAATNKDLSALINEGRFRRDLYERLKVIVIALPPLRERREDIRLLASRFIEAWNVRYNERRFLTEDTLLFLESYAWPGNIRELDNALKSAACSAASDAIGPESLPDEIRHSLNTDHEVFGHSPAISETVEDHRLPKEGINLKARLL
ncbi:MAG TPA: sigma 54-interacting transcriptional regulator, partial [Spirochaetia bacterium]|nr:sigma 54-interacting transcriptional regulator [Spirochaetia bacterium]